MGKRKTAKKKAPSKKPAAKSPAESPATAVVAEDIDSTSLRKIFDDASKAEDKGFGLRQADVECPYCGEEFEISVDPSEEGQEMIQDCSVCCRAITFDVQVIEGELSINAYRD